MQYYIQAYDFKDTEALERRLRIRPAHLELMRQLKADGHFITGGAILSEEGQMIGSVLLLEFIEESGLMKWLGAEPYIREKVWDRVEIKPFRVAEL